MTTAIVMNTLNAAVTEYSWTLQSLTQTQGASSAGLFTLGGNSDAGVAIAAPWMGPQILNGGVQKQGIECVYFAMRGSGTAGENGTLRVNANGTEYRYPFAIRASGVSRGVPGKGISENYLAVGHENIGGADFRIDRVEPVLKQSKQRKAF